MGEQSLKTQERLGSMQGAFYSTMRDLGFDPDGSIDRKYVLKIWMYILAAAALPDEERRLVLEIGPDPVIEWKETDARGWYE